MDDNCAPHKAGTATAPTAQAYLTFKQLVLRTTLSPSTLQRLKKNSKLPYFQPGGPGTRVLFPADAVERCIGQATEVPSPPEPPKTSLEVRHGRRPRWLDQR